MNKKNNSVPYAPTLVRSHAVVHPDAVVYPDAAAPAAATHNQEPLPSRPLFTFVRPPEVKKPTGGKSRRQGGKSRRHRSRRSRTRRNR